MSLQITMTLSQLQQAFEENDFNFLCFAAEWLVEKERHTEAPPVQANSLSMWRALYAIDSEIFNTPPANPTQEELYRDTVVLNYWLNPTMNEQFNFARELTSREYNFKGRANRRGLLAELVKRHGTEVTLDLEFTEV